ncbi:MAG TPA: hypothetical protein VM266_00045 [Solirubrobacteraceae bacterium]|nr:hypothetical protein [Solirubrobacteraceae bacterium]
MGYVAVGILFLIIASIFITYLVMHATRRASPANAQDETADDRDDTSSPGIGADHTPFGDTAEHAGEQTAAGETVTANDAGPSGGTGSPVGGAKSADATTPAGEAAEGRFKRDPIGGEGEGAPSIEADPPRP